MKKINKVFMSEIIKLKNSRILYLHLSILILFPTSLAIFFGYSNYPMTQNVLLTNLFMLISVVTPVIVSIISSMVNNREKSAGNYKNLLDTYINPSEFVQSQVIFFMILYLVEIMITSTTYWIILVLFFNAALPSIIFLWIFNLAFSLLAFFQYEFYFIIVAMFGISGSLVSGFIGFIISSLSATTIFDRFWYFIPWSWQIRMVAYWQDIFTLNSINVISYCSLFLPSLFFTIVIFLAFFKFFSNYFK